MLAFLQQRLAREVARRREEPKELAAALRASVKAGAAAARQAK